MEVVKKTFFVAKDIEEKNDIDSHITFAEKLINKYKWEKDVKDKFCHLLENIKEKQRDDMLNLSVVGEFSTGKSTFINAMLRSELLASSAMQGTTVASTVIEYSEEYSIRLVYNDGNEEVHRSETARQLQEKIIRFSTDSEIGKGLDKIVVGVPSENLKSGFRIIDTPGTNALETWHEEVTVKTIKEISDVSIVLVDATKPLPETLCMFIDDNLGEILDRCVFVATKIDLVREKERDKVLAYIKVKLQQMFEIEEPLVLPYVSVAVIDSVNSPENADREAVAISEGSEGKILMHMAHQRVLNQSRNLTGLIEGVYKSVKENMENVLKTYQDELNELLKTQKTDISGFVEDQKQIRVQDFDSVIKNRRADYLNEFYRISFYSQNRIAEEIDSLNNIEALKNYISYTLGNECVREATGILNSADAAYYQIVTWFNNEMRNFQYDFESNFKNLRALGIVVPQRKYTMARVVNPEQNLTLADAGRQLALEIENEQKNVLSSRFVGNLAANHRDMHSQVYLARAKTNVKSKLGETLGAYFDDVVKKAIEIFDMHVKAVRQGIYDGIDRYVIAYRGAVDRRVSEEQGRRMLVEQRLDNIKADMNEIDRRKEKLYTIGEQMSSLMREE